MSDPNKIGIILAARCLAAVPEGEVVEVARLKNPDMEKISAELENGLLAELKANQRARGEAFSIMTLPYPVQELLEGRG